MFSETKIRRNAGVEKEEFYILIDVLLFSIKRWFGSPEENVHYNNLPVS